MRNRLNEHALRAVGIDPKMALKPKSGVKYNILCHKWSDVCKAIADRTGGQVSQSSIKKMIKDKWEVEITEETYDIYFAVDSMTLVSHNVKRDDLAGLFLTTRAVGLTEDEARYNFKKYLGGGVSI